MNPSIFKSYDIRGVFPEELDEKTAFLIGRAFAVFAKAKKIAVCQDVRLSSPILFKAITDGLTFQGADVFNLGILPTECLYFAVGKYGYEAGIMVTASHNPKEYNGFKMIRNKEGIVRGKNLLEIVQKGEFPEPKNKGEIKDINILKEYLDYVLSFAGKIKPLKVILDPGNGVMGKALSSLIEKLPINSIFINAEPDGNFPNRPPNPLIEGASDLVSKKITEEKADMGFMFDGDGDRIFLVDEKGEMVRADVSLLIIARYFLKNNPGKAIIYNAICSKSVPELVEKWGGKPVRTAVGFVNIAEGMKENDGIMGGELSGHYCFKNNFNSDSGLMAFLILLSAISESGKEVSQIAKELTLYAKGAEINFKTEKKEEIISRIKEEYSKEKQDYLDGVTVEFDDWWFNIRASNTEPLLRLTIEAKNKELLEEKKKKLTELIKKEI